MGTSDQPYEITCQSNEGGNNQDYRIFENSKLKIINKMRLVMKKLKLITIMLAIAAFIGIQACSEEPGIGGNAHIHGTVVEHHEDGGGDDHSGIAGALVHIWYGQADATGDPNDQITTDVSGGFEFENLTKGDYFLHAEFEDDHEGALELKEGTAHVVIETKSQEVEVELEVE